MQNQQHLEKLNNIQGVHPYNLRQAIERFERKYIRNILELTRWDRWKTAEMLGIAPDTLTAKIRRYHLSPGHDP